MFRRKICGPLKIKVLDFIGQFMNLPPTHKCHDASAQEELVTPIPS